MNVFDTGIRINMYFPRVNFQGGEQPPAAVRDGDLPPAQEKGHHHQRLQWSHRQSSLSLHYISFLLNYNKHSYKFTNIENHF